MKNGKLHDQRPRLFWLAVANPRKICVLRIHTKAVKVKVQTGESLWKGGREEIKNRGLVGARHT